MSKQPDGRIGPYSPAFRAGNLLFVSGQIPLDPQTGRLVDGDIRAQTQQALSNVRRLVESHGLGMSAIARTTVYLADLADFAVMNDAYAEFFTEPYPARSTIQAARLPRDARIEVDAIAVFDVG